MESEDELEKEMSNLEAEIEKELEERRGKLKGPFSKHRLEKLKKGMNHNIEDSI